MENKIKQMIILDWVDFDDAAFVDEAIERIRKKAPDTLDRQTVNHYKILEEKDLFGNIQEMCKYLYRLEDEGFQSVSQVWDGYEDNHFQANKYEYETDDEMVYRLGQIISKEVGEIVEEIMRKKEKKAEIEELRAKLRKLESEL